MEIFKLYHHVSKNKKEKTMPSLPSSDWPKEWKTVKIKTYPRFTCYNLPQAKSLSEALSNVLTLRTSKKKNLEKCDLQSLSDLLYYSVGKKERKEIGEKNEAETRMYPSAGALYPIEFYVVLFKPIENLVSGVYHYNVEKHGLVIIKKCVFNDITLELFARDGYAKNATFAVVMTAIYSRSVHKYGERSYRFIMLEAGGVAQNLSLCATALHLNALNVGGIIDDYVENLLNIDGENESIVHSVFFS
jgi:SagB-type dehydrogenase family enzyme